MKRKKRAYRNGAVKLMQVPERYRQGFLKDLDKRTEDYQRLMLTYNTVLSDLGGEEVLSRVRHGNVSLCCPGKCTNAECL